MKKRRKEEKLENPKIGVNEPCYCGSGKKYKKCCREKDEAVLNFWSKGSYIQSVDKNAPDFDEKMKYFHEDLNEEKKYQCGACKIHIGKHNLYWHEGMCDDCFFDKHGM